jgi:hypothetical protein
MTRDELDPRSDADVVLVREVVGTASSREELDALVDRLTTSGFDRGDISLMASHDAVVRKLRAIYRDPVEIAEAPDLPRRDLVTRDDVTSVSAVVSGRLSASAAWDWLCRLSLREAPSRPSSPRP